ncbi:hypothetical protein FIBSPDRAFT_847191 [Athelia psychrophila]|uniref:Uncharacterized protein n=1 Tax=Athelia psychrophila TaxID=1759441 RepID=A0A166WRY6_9AGAM|nr:hypothetical protein FIBSPDRAFT_847191 [Fibularhizoctonia sp. CBS 109695]
MHVIISAHEKFQKRTSHYGDADRLAIVQSINDIWEIWNSKPMSSSLAAFRCPDEEGYSGIGTLSTTRLRKRIRKDKGSEFIDRVREIETWRRTVRSAETDEELVTKKLRVGSSTAVSEHQE